MRKLFLILTSFLLTAVLFSAQVFADGLPVLDKVDGALSLSDAITGGLAIVVGLIFRLVPTQKPLSIAYLVAGIFNQLGSICTKLGKLGDKILPQKLAPAPAPAEPPKAE